MLWLAATVIGGCGEEPPSVKIAGGGFVFNYRSAEACYGFVADVGGDVPDGAVLEATFEDPAGGPPIRLQKPYAPGRQRYKFETPPLQGIAADTPYRVTLSLRTPGGGAVLATAERSFASNLAQSALPPRPLAVGPGYHTPQPASGGTE